MKRILAAFVMVTARAFSVVQSRPGPANQRSQTTTSRPEAIVTLNGRSYGIYISLQRVIPGIMPEGGLPAPDVDVNITLFTLDGNPVPGNLPGMAGGL
jgi:hypothetical protein